MARVGALVFAAALAQVTAQESCCRKYTSNCDAKECLLQPGDAYWVEPGFTTSNGVCILGDDRKCHDLVATVKAKCKTCSSLSMDTCKGVCAVHGNNACRWFGSSWSGSCMQGSRYSKFFNDAPPPPSGPCVCTARESRSTCEPSSINDNCKGKCDWDGITCWDICPCGTKKSKLTCESSLNGCNSQCEWEDNTCQKKTIDLSGLGTVVLIIIIVSFLCCSCITAAVVYCCCFAGAAAAKAASASAPPVGSLTSYQSMPPARSLY